MSILKPEGQDWGTTACSAYWWN